MARWTATSGPRSTAPRSSARSISRVSNVERPPGWLPLSVICEVCGKVGTTLATDWDGETVAYACKPDHVEWATRLRPQRARRAVRRTREAAVQRRLGRQVEPLRRHRRGLRQGPRHEGRAAVTAATRSAAQVFEREPPLNVAYEFLNIGGRKMSTSTGHGRGRARDGRPPAARAAALPVPAPQAPARDRLRPRGRRHPRPVRRVRPGRRGHRRACRCAGSCRPTRSASSPRASSTPMPTSLRRPPLYRPPFRHLALLVQVPGVDLEERSAAEKGAPLDERERAILAERARVATALARGVRARALPRRRPGRAARPRGGADRGAGALPRRPRRRRRGRATRRPAMRGRTSSTAHRSGAASPRAMRSRPCTRRSSGARTARARAGSSRASIGRWSSSGCAPRPPLVPTPRSGWTGRAGHGRRRRRRHVSVGAARLRAEPDVIRAGAVAKGEDPALVDQALAADERRRDAARARGRRCEPSASGSPSRSARRSAAAPTRAGREVTALRERSTALGTEIDELDAQVAAVDAELEDLLLRIPNPPDPGIPVGGEEASTIVRTWGEPLPARGAGARRHRAMGPPAALGGRRGARPHRPGGRREDRRAPDSPSTGAPEPRSSGRSSTGSSSSTPASTA